MKTLRMIGWALCVVGLVGASPRLVAKELNDPPDGFTALFNGKNLEGWWGAGTENPRKWMKLSEEELAAKKRESRKNIRKHWRVEDGVLVNDGHGKYLTTNENYGDFELLIDYKTVPKADSGIYLRGIPQVQIWDYTKEGGKWDLGADKGSGGLWNNPEGAPGRFPRVRADKPFGEWNHFRIVMVGARVTVFLNGKRIVDHARLHNFFGDERPIPRKGPIQLQTHGGEIRWRNIFLREIPPEEANRILREHGVDKRAPKGLEPIFNGEDLTGWAGAVDGYEAVDGTLGCRKGSGGTIYTERTYRDFLLELGIRIPAGGNNGIAVRYPGSGNPAFDGMCELQILDNSHPKYDDLNPHQYHGSVYGMVPAHRGYQRPAGTWNFQRVRVQGSKVRVELNGFRIVDADLSKVDPETFMAPPKKFKGRDRREGHIGFAGHGDPVRFRNVRIKELD